MARYDEVWRLLVERAIKQSQVDIETFMNLARQSGLSDEKIAEKLLDDINNDGPLFGKFFRSLFGAAESSVVAAMRAGSTAGYYSTDDEIKKRLALVRTEGIATDEEFAALAIENADPEALAQIEADGEEYDYRTWVATLERTCDECLPLHGHTLTLAEWKRRGFLPELMHKGWTSSCKCDLVPAVHISRSELEIAPLMRAKIKSTTGLKTSKMTQRQVLQSDIDKALAARDRAKQSELGRRTLRLLGEYNPYDVGE